MNKREDGKTQFRGVRARLTDTPVYVETMVVSNKINVQVQTCSAFSLVAYYFKTEYKAIYIVF